MRLTSLILVFLIWRMLLLESILCTLYNQLIDGKDWKRPDETKEGESRKELTKRTTQAKTEIEGRTDENRITGTERRRSKCC